MMQTTNERSSNRLINEKSPYLLQHADNPVDWYPWGDEAFEKARRENKPIFLSIGYSTCHWCHVMEHESFEDEEVARLMNQHFVNIKVDREERPDLDQIYMTVCQMMTGGGGWPLTVLLTPERKPFFAGTYFPRDSRFGRVGMTDLVPRIGQYWQTRRDEAERVAEEVLGALKQHSEGPSSGGLNRETLQAAYQQLAGRFDSQNGGFSSAPKFPTPHNLLFLLRYHQRTGDTRALEMVEKTLDAMRRGGMYDHLGFGFHRYSTDSHWLVPHFEKMLYDQALLAMAYTEAFQLTRKPEYRQTADEIFTYIFRDMTSPEGGFYSAEDADSEGEEGKFYVWTAEEIRKVLEKDSELALAVWNVSEEGNFLEEATGHRTGANILHLRHSLSAAAEGLGITPDELNTRLKEARKRLFEVREKRIHPLKDDKILTDWNGLMIAALAKAGRVLGETRYTNAAKKSADWILGTLRSPDGHLLHRYREGEAALPGNLDDYAYLVWGLLELYESSFEVRYLREALALNRTMLDLFWDQEHGGLYFASNNGEELPARLKEIYDGAMPSGNSVAMLNLLRLGRMVADADLESKANRIGQAFSSRIESMPSAHTLLMCALEFALGDAREIIIVGDPLSDDTQALLSVIDELYIPGKVVLHRQPGQAGDGVESLADYLANYDLVDGKAAAYICQNYACQQPVTDPEALRDLLGQD